MHDEKRFDPARKGYLVSPDREARWSPQHFLLRLGLRTGQSVVDVGSGPGFWTLPLAGIVGPAGRVWALDVSQELLDDLAARNPPSQVQPVPSVLTHIELPDAAADLAWVAFVIHEVEPPAAFSAELRRVVKPGGRVAVLNWRPAAAGQAGPPRAHRVSPEQVIAWLNLAGFAGSRQTISQHFGRAPYYAVFIVEDGEVIAQEQRKKLAHEHGPGEHHHEGERSPTGGDTHTSMLALIRDCQVLLARGMGSPAYESLQSAGITPVITDVASIMEAVQGYMAGSLVNHTERLH
jgi:SAM-dependent methyltransferase